MARDLSAKQARFVEEYLVSLNATQAAIKAGYSAKTARQIGEENLSKHYIAAAIAEAKSERSQRTMITQDRVLRELACIAFFDIGKAFTPEGGLLPLDQMDEDTRRALSGLEVVSNFEDGEHAGYLKKVKIADKIAALDRLGKHLGLFEERIKISGDESNPLVLLIKTVQGSALKTIPSSHGANIETEK